MHRKLGKIPSSVFYVSEKSLQFLIFALLIYSICKSYLKKGFRECMFKV